MTQENGSKISEAVQLVMDYGFEGMEEAVRILLNEAMRLERERCSTRGLMRERRRAKGMRTGTSRSR